MELHCLPLELKVEKSACVVIPHKRLSLTSKGKGRCAPAGVGASISEGQEGTGSCVMDIFSYA